MPAPIIAIGLIVLNLLKISGVPFAIQCIPKLAIYFYLGYLIVKYEKPIYSYFINNKKPLTIFDIDINNMSLAEVEKAFDELETKNLIKLNRFTIELQLLVKVTQLLLISIKL